MYKKSEYMNENSLLIYSLKVLSEIIENIKSGLLKIYYSENSELPYLHLENARIYLSYNKQFQARKEVYLYLTEAAYYIKNFGCEVLRKSTEVFQRNLTKCAFESSLLSKLSEEERKFLKRCVYSHEYFRDFLFVNRNSTYTLPTFGKCLNIKKVIRTLENLKSVSGFFGQ